MVVPFSHSNTLFVTRDGVPMRFYIRPGPQKRHLAPLIAHGGGLMCRIQEPGAFLLADPSEAAQGPGYISTTYIHDCVSANRSLSPRVYRLLPRTLRGATAARDASGRMGHRAFGGNPMTFKGVDNIEASGRRVPEDDSTSPASRALEILDGDVSQRLTAPVTSRDGHIEQLKHRPGLASSHGTSSKVMDTGQVLPVDLNIPVMLDLRTSTLASGARADAFVGEDNPLASPSKPMDLKCKEVDRGQEEDPKNVTGLVTSNSPPLGEPSGEHGAQRQLCFPSKMGTKLVLKEDHGTQVTSEPKTSTPAPKAPPCAPNHEEYLSVLASPFKKTDAEVPGGHKDDLQNNTGLATCKDPSSRGASPFPSKIASELFLYEDSSAPVITDPRKGTQAPSAPNFGKDSEVDTGYDSITMNNEGSLSSSASRVPKRKFRDRKRPSGGEDSTSQMAKQKRAEKQLHILVPGDEPEKNLQTPRLDIQEQLSMNEQQVIIHERATGGKRETVYERTTDGEQGAVNEGTMGEGQVAVNESILEEGQRSVYKCTTGGEQVATYERDTGGEQVVLPERPAIGEQGATCERPTGGEQGAVCVRPTCGKQIAMCEESTRGKQRAVCEGSMGLEQGDVCKGPTCAEQEAVCKRPNGGELGYVCERSKGEEQLAVCERTTRREHMVLHERTAVGEQVAIGKENKSVTMRTIHGGHNNYVTEIQTTVTSGGECSRGSTQEPLLQHMDNQQVQPVMCLQSPNRCAALAQGRMAFTREEDIAILIYVRDHISTTRTVTGNRLWKDLEEKRVLRRSWQAMKARYVKYLTNHKYKYKLPPKSQPLCKQDYATEKTPDSTINNCSPRSSRSAAPQKPPTGNSPQRCNVPLPSDCGNTPQKYTTTALENNAQHVPSTGSHQRTSGPEKSASADTPQGNDFTQHGASALKSSNVPQNCGSTDTTHGNHAPQQSASPKSNVLQHSASSYTLQASNAPNGASAPLRSNVPPNSASAGTTAENNATQHGTSAGTTDGNNATQHSTSAGTTDGNNATQHGASAGTTDGNNATQHGASAGTTDANNAAQHGASAGTTDANNAAQHGASAGTTDENNATQHGASAGATDGNNATQHGASAGTTDGSNATQHGASAGTTDENNATQHGASAGATDGNNATQHGASAGTTDGSNATQHGASAGTTDANNAAQHGASAGTTDGNNAAQHGASAGTTDGNNATQHGASAGTTDGNNATQHGASAGTTDGNNATQHGASTGTTDGNNATQHGASAGTLPGSNSSTLQRSKVPENSDNPHGNDATQLDASSDTHQKRNAQNGASVPQRKDVLHNCASLDTPNEKHVTESGAFSDTLQGSCTCIEACTPQKCKTTHRVLSTTSHSSNQNSIPESSSLSTSKARSPNPEDDYESSSRKGSSMLSSPRPGNTAQLAREETDGSEELHIFQIANMEFEDEDNKGSGQPAAGVPPEEAAVSSNQWRPDDEMTSSQEEESEGLQEAITDLMREFQLDLFSVTQALFFNNGEVGSTRHFLDHGLRPDGFPIWDPKDDSDLSKSDPKLQARLIKKYGADNVAKRVAFLAS